MTPSPRQSPKENKLKEWPKIYVLQCTLYVLMNVHLGFKKNLTQMVQNYSELYLAVPPPTHCRLPPETDLICICVTCRWILDLKK
jgi:hypothetical protein